MITPSQFPLLEATVDAVVVIDAAGSIVVCNSAAEASFGHRREALLGRRFESVLFPERLRERLARELAAGGGQLLGQRSELPALHADGSERRVELTLSALVLDGAQLFVAYVRDLTERLRAEAQREQASAELAATMTRIARLQESTARLAGADSVVEIANAVLAAGVGALGAETAVFVRPFDDANLAIVASVGVTRDVLDQLRIVPRDSIAPTATAFRTGQAEWIEDEATFRGRYQAVAAIMETATSAVAALPLMIRDAPAAAVGFRFGAGRRFDADDRALLTSFAIQAAHALERVLSHEEQVAARRRLESLAELTAALATTLSEAEVAATVMERGTSAMAADTCMLFRVEPDGALALLAERGCPPPMVAGLRRIDGASAHPTLRSLLDRRTLWVETEAEYREAFPVLAAMKVEGPRAKAFWSVPLVVEDQTIGLLAMGFYAPRRFAAEERVFIETFARNAAQALRRGQRLESERRARRSLETTLRSIGDAVIATDTAGVVTFLNPVAERLTGWSQAEALGRDAREVFRIVDHLDGAAATSPIHRALTDGAVGGLGDHLLLVARAGARLPIEDSAAPIRDELGAIAGAVLVFRDVSQKRRDELRRRFIEDAMVALVESLDYETTLGNVARLVVPGLADWCSLDIVIPGQARPKRLAVAHVDPAKMEMAKELDARYPPPVDSPSGVPNVLRTGRSEMYAHIPDEMLVAGCVDAEHLRIARSLQLRSAMVVPLTARDRVLGAMTFVFAESGRAYTADDLQFAEDVARRCAIAIDNARLYASELSARHSADVANRAKDEFLAIVSHELRTPLNAIMGWSKLMAAPRFDDNNRVRAVDTIARNAVAMAQLIEDLLDISRIVSGKMRLEVQQLELARVIEAALEAVKPAADAKNILIAASYERGLPRLVGDPARLQQIAWNLLSNAVKFTARDGRIAVDVRLQDSWAELSVADSGKGIAPAFLPFVFDSFRQEDASHTRSRGGLGLGLAITRQLVELHGGRIHARSDGEGRGATFTVRLPISAVAHPTPPAGVTAHQISTSSDFPRPPQLRGLRVLVVDDQEDARRLVNAILEQCGCQVTLAASVEEALAALGREVPDALLSDIGMPDADGYDLIRRVRALAPEAGGDVPAAALSAYARAEERSLILNAGFTMHIPKPVEPAELVAAVTSLTRFQQRRRPSADPVD